MNLDDLKELDLFNRLLTSVYFNAEENDEVVLAIPSGKEYENTINYFSNLFQKDAQVREFIIERDYESLFQYISLYNTALLGKYGSIGTVLRTLCEENDYKSIISYLEQTYQTIMSIDLDNIDITSSDFCAITNMIIDFYQEALNHNFKDLFEYATECKLSSKLYYLIKSYIESDKANEK